MKSFLFGPLFSTLPNMVLQVLVLYLLVLHFQSKDALVLEYKVLVVTLSDKVLVTTLAVTQAYKLSELTDLRLKYEKNECITVHLDKFSRN